MKKVNAMKMTVQIKAREPKNVDLIKRAVWVTYGLFACYKFDGYTRHSKGHFVFYTV